jgi:hypothetical protein
MSALYYLDYAYGYLTEILSSTSNVIVLSDGNNK